MQRTIGCCAVILLTGCAHTCEDRGVLEQYDRLGRIAIAQEIPESQLHTLCGPHKAGCVIDHGEEVSVYWRNGDNCAREHELCHVEHGAHHTHEYWQDVIANHPRPYCP